MISSLNSRFLRGQIPINCNCSLIQVSGVTDAERDLAFGNLRKAASHFDIQMKETDWHQFGA